MNNAPDTLKNVTQTILFQPTQYGEIRNGLHQLHEVYASATGIVAGNITDEDMWLPSGNAVSPIKAAHCLLEIQRTGVFIRGIYKALLRLQKDFPGERIHVLYAGCGPYASLVTSLTSMFTAKEVAFHLLDINPVSIQSAQRLYEHLQLTDYVAEYICTDATTYKLPESTTIHLAISETMLNGLRKEPQVEIMLNLVPQLHPNAFFIPDTITVSAQLLDRRKESSRHLDWVNEPQRINLGTIYTIGRAQCRQQEKTIVQIPSTPGGYNSLHLLTDIHTFEEERLSIYESSLNMPLRIGEVDGYEGRKIAFTYLRGEKPGFVHEWQ